MTERRKPGTERRRPGADLEGEGTGDPVARLRVKKTWKLYVGGSFVRSESGHYLVTADGLDNTPRGSRKDLRDAVKAALAAQASWLKKSAYNRGQIVYRLAEVLEGRRTELVQCLEQGGTDDAEREVDAAIDRTVSYAGWADKFQSLFASSNPVAGPHFGFSVPEPIGVVGIVAPDRPALLGLLGSVCPVVVSGNVAVVIASEADPRTALLLGEALATSDLPGGVVNLLTGVRAELLSHLARHAGVRALDLWGIEGDEARDTERLAADNVKRVTRRSLDAAAWLDAERCTAPGWIERFVETKTVWHPMGA